MWYVYIIECKDKKLYTGITNDLSRRLDEHNSGHGARFTRTRYPVKLVYLEESPGRSEALSREAGIKTLRRAEKLKIIRSAKPETI